MGIDGGTMFFWTAPSGGANSAVPLNGQLVIENNGNIGVGISPSYKFHIKSADLQSVLQTDGTGNNRAIVAFADAAGSLQGSMGLFGSDGSIRIGDATDYRIVIKQGGNVGIGTASPSQKLTVNGTIYGKEVKVDLSVPGPDYVLKNPTIFPHSKK